MMWWDGGWAWWGWLIMGVMMIGFWVAVAWVVVAVIRSVGTGAAAIGGGRGMEHPSGPDNAERILAERYARGEIDADEYHRRLDDLRAHRSSAA